MKHVFTFLFALLLLISGKSQSWEKLSEQFEELYSAKKYDKAIFIGEKVIVAAKKEFGEINFRYTNSLVEIVDLYNILGQYKKAEPYCLQLISVEKKRGEDSEGYFESLKRLGGVYIELGEYKKAEPLFLQAASSIKRKLDESSRGYANTLNDLAVLYGYMGQYDKAELYLIETKEIYKGIKNGNNPGFATCLSNLGYLYELLGQLDKAESFYLQAKNIREKFFGIEHLDYANSLNSLGSLYTEMGEYKKSEAYIIQAMKIREKMLGIEHVDYANSLQLLAYLYEKKSEYLRAEPLYIQAADIDKRQLGNYHPTYAADLYNLAMVNTLLGKYPEAEMYLIQSQEIKKRVFGEKHPDYINALSSLSLLYVFMGQYKKAEPILLQYGTGFLDKLKQIFLILSEKEKNNILKKLELLGINESFLFKYSGASSEFKKVNFNLHLFFKSLSLIDTKRKLDQIRNSKDTLVKKKFIELQSSKSTLAMQYSLPLGRRREDLKNIEVLAENQEKELNRRSSTYRNGKQEINISLTEVQRQMSDNEIAIEFTSFELYNGIKQDSIIYGAYILHKDDSVPVFVPLCEEKQLQRLWDSAGTTATSIVNKFYRGLGLENKSAAGTLGSELYKLIWQPLEPYLKGVKKVCYSPAGKLYSIAFHALPVDSSSVLMEKYELQQYTSTRQLALRNIESQSSKPVTITLFGNAQYTLDSIDLEKQKENHAGKENGSASVYTLQKRSNDNSTWSSLPGTADEVSKIKQLFDENKVFTNAFVQKSASEENLKALNGTSPQILHIATHGFFLPEPDMKKNESGLNEQNSYSLADDPLLRSGLILAGGNYAWSGKTPITGIEDGIATAYEISQLDLSNTELVVLSACETALGDVKGSEGVFGLQRAFKMAGVKKMIVSLWQVPDKETAELMTAFYTYWMDGKTINEAFTQAQAEMRKKYAPFYWAAFVLVE